MKEKIVLLLGLIVFMASCTKEPDDYPPEPQIYYQGTIPNRINLTQSDAKVRIELKFHDGDGDLGHTENAKSVFLKSSKDTTSAPFTYEYPFPYIPDHMRPKQGGLEGFIDINLGVQFFTIPPWDTAHLNARKDTLQYTIYIMDETGHKSNLVTSDTIYVEF